MEENEDDDREYFISKIIDGMFSYLDSAYLPHVLTVLNAVPIADLKKLAKSDAALFAIDPNRLGLVLGPRSFWGPIIYLSPALPSLPESEIRAVIAHEFAHVALGHMNPPEKDALDKSAESGEKTAYELGKSDEKTADKLAESWGFKLPQSYTDRL
jgi:hypothetical protein